MNNAGATAIVPLAEITGARIAELFALNVTAPSLLARAALPHLREVHGSIVNVSSTFGHRPLPGGSHYAASKSAIEMLTQSWALELAEENVRVNAVAPGPTESEALAASGLPGERSTRSNRMRQLGFRWGGAVNPRTSRPGSFTSRTLPPRGSPDRSSPSTVALNSPDRQRTRTSCGHEHADPTPVSGWSALRQPHLDPRSGLLTRSTSQPPGYVVGTWTIDSAQSSVAFTIRHLLIHKVRGTFGAFTGKS